MKLRVVLFSLACWILGATAALAVSYSIVVPTGLSAIANQLNNGANTLDVVLPAVPDGTIVYKWNCSGYVAYNYDAAFGGWFPAGGTLKPGEGAFINNPGPAFVLTFTGTAVSPVLPAALPCGCDQLNFLARQTDGTGLYENVTGRSPINGAAVYRWNVPTQAYIVHTYSAGAWAPAIPTLNIGESAFFLVPCQAKWLQVPDTTTNGLDVKATFSKILADDFRCTATGPITQIRVWGSWRFDQIPAGGANFCLGIWTDIPKQGTNYSRPGVQLCNACFNPSQYRSFIYTNANERFLDPNIPAITGTDTNIWEYDFILPTNNPCFQTNGNIYWVSLWASGFDTNQFNFGWKTCPTNFNDDAVFGHVSSAGIPLLDWKELRRIPGNSNSLDLAFQIITETNTPPTGDTNKWYQPPDTSTNGLDVRATQPKILADDFLCTATGPISQIQVWGSWRYDQVPTVPPCICLAIWTDIPANAPGANGYSRPGQRLCNYCYQSGQYTYFPYTNGVFERFWDPNLPGTNGFIGTDTVIWQYIFNIPTNQPCIQTNGNVYWLSLWADCFDTNQFLFGWKTTPYNWNDDAVYGHVDAAGFPLLDWRELRRPPAYSNSLDLAFKIITRPSNCLTAVACPVDKTIYCTNAIVFDPPFVGTNCCGTNITITSSAITNGTCPKVITVTWTIVDCTGYTTTCAQRITILDTSPPLLSCPPDKTYPCGAPWGFDSPTATDDCCTNVTINVVSTITNGSGCSQVICRAWQAVDCCTNYSLICTQCIHFSTNPPTGKWLQIPDTSTNGLDVKATQPKILADDFRCDYTGPIVRIRVWGSWRSDNYWPQPCFCLGIWGDVPKGPNNPYSHPGQLLWTNCFNAGQYTWFPYTNVNFERFWDPNIPGTNGYIGTDTIIWEYDFDIPEAVACWQTNGTIYWLSLWADCFDPSQFIFGWKTCPTNWNDDAVFGHVDPAGFPLNDWRELIRPATTNSVDLSFEIITKTNPPPGTNAYKWLQVPDATPNGLDVRDSHGKILADDFRCTATGPITQIKLWGSWLYDNYSPQPRFCLGIWSDIPKQGTNYSRPGNLLCTNCFLPGQYTYAPYTNSDELFFDPNVPGIIGSDTIIWEYTFNIPDTQACWQTNGNVYWLSVWADGFPTNFLYGWKTCPTNWNDDAVFGHFDAAGNPLRDWKELRRPPFYTNSLDLSFQLITKSNPCPPIAITCPVDKTVYCGTAWSFDQPNVYSPCCGTNYSLAFTRITNGRCPIVVTGEWVAIDNCNGSVASCPYKVTIVDTNPPILTCAATKTVPCNAIWSFDTPTAIDDCCGTNITINIVSTITSGTCPQIVSRAWQAVDCCTNYSLICTQRVILLDTNPPTIACGNNKTVLCGTTWAFDTPAATDACCGTNVTINIVSTTTNGGICNQTITRIWQAVDCCTNSSLLCTQRVTVVDSTPPLLTCGTNKTVLCGTTWSFDTPTATDACCGTNVTINIVSTTTNGGICNQTITRVWQAVDCCTNSSLLCTQRVTVIDTVSPLLICAPNKTVICGSAWTFDSPTATDACCGTNITINIVSTITNGSGCTQLVYRAWQAVDCCTNFSLICTQCVNLRPPDTNIVIVDKWVQVPDVTTNGIDVRDCPPKVLADDFLCKCTGPITQIRVWGSWRNDLVAQPCFCLGIWSDVPRNGTNYSRPGNLLWNNCFQANQYTNFVYSSGVPERFYDPNLGTNLNAYIGTDTVIWEYVFDIPASQACWQTNNTIYWLSVSADCFDTNQFLYGWKTCPTNWNDDAVFGHENPFNVPLRDWKELRRPGTTNSLDLAFVVTTSATNAPPPPVNTNTLPGLKWIQRPDLTPTGLDTLATIGTGSPIVADDFMCTSNGYITDIHLWGSWLYDYVELPTFELKIWKDVPRVGTQPSHPGAPLWTNVFTAGNYNVSLLASNIFWEGFYDPSQTNVIGTDTRVYQYDFVIPPCFAFHQYYSNIYWLSVTAYATNWFGWKTCITNDHFNDDATWSPNIAGTVWRDLHYPPGHPFAPQTMDMAFALTTLGDLPKPVITIQHSNGVVILRWTNGCFLQCAPVVTGPYTNVPGATSPYVTPVVGPHRFYRICMP